MSDMSDPERSKNTNDRPPRLKQNRSSRSKSSNQKAQTDQRNKIALLVAIATGIGAIGSAIVTGVFQTKNLDARLKNLGPIQMEGDAWVVGYGDRGWSLGTPTTPTVNGDPIGGVPQNSRDFTYHVNFKEKFSSPPHVVVSVTMLDEWKNGGVKWVVGPFNVSTDGFDIKIEAYPESVIYTVGGNWLAFQR
jgi:hypothetical protein